MTCRRVGFGCQWDDQHDWHDAATQWCPLATQYQDSRIGKLEHPWYDKTDTEQVAKEICLMACQPGYTPLEFCVLDADVPRYVEAMANHFGYQEFLDSPDNQVPNPQTKGQFAKSGMADWMEQIVVQGNSVESSEVIPGGSMTMADFSIPTSYPINSIKYDLSGDTISLNFNEGSLRTTLFDMMLGGTH